MTVYSFYGWVMAYTVTLSTIVLMFFLSRYQTLFVFFIDFVVYVATLFFIVLILLTAYRVIVFVDSYFVVKTEGLFKNNLVEITPRVKTIVAKPTEAHLLPDMSKEIMPNLIQEMVSLDRILLLGGSGSGKTNTLKCYITELKRLGKKVTVVDPHSREFLGLKTVGGGLNFQEVEDFFQTIRTNIASRYANGDIDEHGTVREYLIIEEFLDINLHTNSAPQFIKCLLVQARKAGYAFCIVSQSQTVKALGVKGCGDLLLGCDVVFLKKDALTKKHRAFIGKGKERYECQTPTAFTEKQSTPKKLKLSTPGKDQLSFF